MWGNKPESGLGIGVQFKFGDNSISKSFFYNALYSPPERYLAFSDNLQIIRELESEFSQRTSIFMEKYRKFIEKQNDSYNDFHRSHPFYPYRYSDF